MKARDALAKNLRRLRDAKDWSQEELAERSGVHRTYISGLERSKRNPTLSIIEDLSLSLDCSVNELLIDDL